MNITDKVKAGQANRAYEQDIEEGTARKWMVYGLVIVTAKDRREATDKAKAGQTDEPWEVLDDVGGFFEPEPYEL